MNNTLHITNGDSAVAGMLEAGIIGDILPWRDVLHIGPVQNLNTWTAFDQSRIDFLTSVKLGTKSYVEKTFAQRISVMNQLHKYDSIYLWFEHDLYDQLQLLQILIWMNTNPQIHKITQLIITDLYLGEATAANFQELFRYSERLEPQHLSVAKSYWQALTHETPLLLNQLDESVILPFMYPAFKRLCAEYPSTGNGLNRVENVVLEFLRETSNPLELFSLYQSSEDARFMGDAVFSLVLNRLIHCKSPLVRSEPNSSNIWSQKLYITDTGNDVLHHKSHNLELNDIDLWIGGVHLEKQCLWCYDGQKEAFSLFPFA